jgi:hypothetical protein
VQLRKTKKDLAGEKEAGGAEYLVPQILHLPPQETGEALVREMKQREHYAETVALVEHFVNPPPQMPRKIRKDTGEEIDIYQEKP